MYNIPLFNAVIEDAEDGIFAVSLVEYPATEEGWLAFNKQEEENQPLYFVKDEDKRLITSVLMKANTPIYRISPSGFQYYIQYSKEVLKQMAEKVIADGTLNNVDIEHNGEYLPKGSVQCMELYIKDVERGINPVGFEQVKDGSLFCTYKVNDDNLWETIKEGNMLNGFSLAGLFTVKEAETYNKHNNKKEKKMSKINQLKTLLMEIICEFSTVTTIDGKELEVASDEIVEGIAIKADDGEYKLDDGRVIVVKDGVIVEVNEEVAEDEPKEEEKKEGEVEVPEEEVVEEEPKEEEVIEEPKEEEVVVEEPTEEVVVEEPTEDEKKEFVDLEELKAKIATLSSEYGTLQAQVNELRDMLSEIASKPAVEPIRDSHEREDFDKYGLKEWRNRK